MMFSNIGMPLNRFILEEERHYSHSTGSLSIALTVIESAAKIIESFIRRAKLADIIGDLSKSNVYGERVKKLDELANNILVQYLSTSGQFYAIASEEMEKPVYPKEGKNSKYIIALDPLDGSSNIDVNISVGSIFSIYRVDKGDESDFLQNPSQQITAGYLIYSSSTVLVYSTGRGVNGFTLDPLMGNFLLSHSNIQIPSSGKIYAFNEAYSLLWSDRMRNYLHSLKQENYTLRYTGAMVADVHRTLLKGGIFAYPSDINHPEGKLRFCFEVAPMSFLIENAGGRALTIDESGNQPVIRSIFDVQPLHLHQRISIIIGSKDDLDKLEHSF